MLHLHRGLRDEAVMFVVSYRYSKSLSKRYESAHFTVSCKMVWPVRVLTLDTGEDERVVANAAIKGIEHIIL